MRTFAFLSVALVLCSSAVQARPPQNDQEREAALNALMWSDGGAATLPMSQGELKAPSTLRQLVGRDAGSLWEILNGVEAPPGTEAALYDPGSKALVFFQKIKDGYVKLDDWNDVDAEAMLKSVSENTEASNERRRAAGISAVHVVGWVERPHLDRANSTVRWSFEARDDASGSLVNSISLVLGRDGFEKLTWVGDKASGNKLLNVAQASFSFPLGGLYSDFKSGDKVAEYGIAGLVAAVLGVKTAAKLGLLAAALAFGKKFFLLLLVPLAGVWAWIKRVVARNRTPPAT